MRYAELTIRVVDPTQAALLMADLEALPVESVTESEGEVKAYIPEVDYREITRSDFPMASHVGELSVDVRWIEHQNWNAMWESAFEPVVIGQDVLLRAPFHQEPNPSDFRYVIEMTPKMAFGTGHHGTTYQMLQTLLDHPAEGADVLDMGCGTGVLAVLAAYQRADRIVGIEIDPHAADNAREIAETNGVADQVDILTGDASSLQGQGRFDVILANINRNVLLHDLPTYAAHAKPGSWLHLSGFYRQDVETLVERAKDCGYSLVSEGEREGWMRLTFKYAE